MEILTKAEAIFDHGNRHMATKLRYLGKAEQNVIKYIISKLRKYHGIFFEAYKEIASVLEISTKTVQRAVKHADQLGIFQVKEQFKPTLDGKMRKTTNLIQLLPYVPFEMVDGVLSIVRTVRKAIKLVEIAKEIVANSKTAQKDKTSKNTLQKPYKRSSNVTRTEVLPEWWDESTQERQTYEQKQEKSMEEKQNELKEQFEKLGIPWKK